MNVTRKSGKRVSAGQRDLATAGSNHATVRKLWKTLATVVFGLLLSVPGLARAQFTTIDVKDAAGTAANGNSTHEIAGEYNDEDGIIYGFVLNKGAFARIDVPDKINAKPTPISPDASLLTTINGINAPGRLVGTYGDGETLHSFLWSKDRFTTLDPPGASYSQGGFINAQGEVVGSYRDRDAELPDQPEKRRGFIWRKGIFTPVNFPGDHPFYGTVAFGINDVGQIVGNYVDKDDKGTPPGRAERRHGFLRSSKGEFTPFDFPGADYTIAEGINNAGTIVGVYVTFADGGLSHGFVRSSGGLFTAVHVPDPISGKLQETEINSINAKGEIAGSYWDAAGLQHGFLGVPVR